MIAAWWKRRREAHVLSKRAIPDALWQATLDCYPFLAARNSADRTELRRLATLFLAQKEFAGAGGLTVTDEMAVSVAAQACLPILELGLDHYDGFVGIVMHSDEVVARRQAVDEAGVVHDYDEVLSGEAMEGGPIMLSWHDVAEAGASAELGYNVVIHEFVHVLDMRDGLADGVPPLPTRAERKRWIDVLSGEYERLREDVDRGFETFLDPYGAEGLDEFFPVASEAFFVAPQGLLAKHPALYGLLSQYFRQDPAQGLA
jgi:Mlc titration factor MtfA (ptsG expression regulator)